MNALVELQKDLARRSAIAEQGTSQITPAHQKQASEA
jgi:hypothetical protein